MNFNSCYNDYNDRQCKGKGSKEMIQLNNVCKSYKNKKGIKTEAIKNINLKFGDKGLNFILGKSGSGKSTLLNIIGGLDNYESGELILFGKNTKNFKSNDYDNYRNNYIGFVFQDFNIIEDYTVYENIMLSIKLQNKKIDVSDFDKLLERLEIGNLKNRKVNELSGGQKQRVAIARALIKKPKVILADEPTGNLDTKTGIEVMNLLKEISKETLVIIVSHNEEYAKEYADRIIKIQDGEIISDSNSLKDVELTECYQKTKTRLPFIDSLKFGVSSLKCKKIKLLFTIILISLSTLFLSIAYIVKSYNYDDNYYNILKNTNTNSLEIRKVKNEKDYKKYLKLNEKDIEYISSNIDSKYNIVYSINDNSNIIDFFNLNIYQQKDLFNDYAEETDLYTYYASNVKIVETNSKENFTNEKLIGNYPTNSDEIIISNYLANLIIENGIYKYNSDEIYKPKDSEELVSSNIYVSFGKYNKIKIVGIIDYDISEFEQLKGLYQKSDAAKITETDLKLSLKLQLYINNIYNRVYVNSDFVDKIDSSEYKSNLDASNIYNVEFANGDILNNNTNVINSNVEYYNGIEWKKTNKLESNQMLISVLDIIGESNYNNYIEKLNNYINENSNANSLELEKEFIENNLDFSEIIGQKVNLKIYEDTEYVIVSNENTPTKEYNDIQVIGICGLINSDNINSLFSTDVLGEYSDKYVEVDSILVEDFNDLELKKYLKIFSNDSKYNVYSLYSDTVQFYYNYINNAKPYINFFTIIFFIFSFILICNFMFNSISSKKKEIGILKALGAKNNDVVKIFIVEGLLLSIISSLLSIILVLFSFMFLNNTILSANNNLYVSPFYVDLKLIFINFMYILIIVIVSSLIPILRISKMKPIDAILNK
jgi:ABC-type lipoprotein export system ATPase subunit